jgi:hypothetical protein
MITAKFRLWDSENGWWMCQYMRDGLLQIDNVAAQYTYILVLGGTIYEVKSLFHNT